MSQNSFAKHLTATPPAIFIKINASVTTILDLHSISRTSVIVKRYQTDGDIPVGKRKESPAALVTH
jgi:hypothetical protein